MGHGGCERHLHRFGLDDLPNCPECGAIAKDSKHVMFHYPRLAMEGRNLNQTEGEPGEHSCGDAKEREGELAYGFLRKSTAGFTEGR